jgi:hypothetical protein
MVSSFAHLYQSLLHFNPKFAFIELEYDCPSVSDGGLITDLGANVEPHRTL